MTLIAPPAVHDAPPTAVEDAVSKEARRRAQRRRVRQGIAVAAVGVARRCHPWLLRGRAAPNGRL